MNKYEVILCKYMIATFMSYIDKFMFSY